MLTPTASELLFADDTSSKRLYWDRSYYESIEVQKEALAKSSTLYVGNPAFSTRTAQVRAHFSTISKVKEINMGLDRVKKTPCGFCFVQYHDRASALAAVANLSGSKLDSRVIRVELDAGFHLGRQYGRGLHGGQVRDEKTMTGRRGPQSTPELGMKRDRDSMMDGDDSAANNINNSNNQPEDALADDMEQQPSAKRRRLSKDDDADDDNDKKNW